MDVVTLSLARKGTPLIYPDGVWHPSDFRFYRIGHQYIHDFDFTTYRNPEGTTYYVAPPPTGKDTNDGLSWSTPFLSINKALTMTDVGKILVLGGTELHKDIGFNNLSPSRDVAIIGVGGMAICSTYHAYMSWTATEGQTNVWQATRTLAYLVVDKKVTDANGDPLVLTKRASVAEVNANPGSFYFDTATHTLYVKLSDQRQPDGYVRVLLDLNNGYINTGKTLYLENICFEGGTQALYALNNGAARPKVIMNHCSVKYGKTNGLSAYGCEWVYSFNSRAAWNLADGFNYHAPAGSTVNFVEYGCEGCYNGTVDGVSNDNGSTAHDGCDGIRIAGNYHHNIGPNVADVNDGTSTYNEGCEIHHSISDAQKLNVSLYGESAAKCKMWLARCKMYGSLQDVSVGAYGELNVRDNHQEGICLLNASGTIQDF